MQSGDIASCQYVLMSQFIQQSIVTFIVSSQWHNNTFCHDLMRYKSGLSSLGLSPIVLHRKIGTCITTAFIFSIRFKKKHSKQCIRHQKDLNVCLFEENVCFNTRYK